MYNSLVISYLQGLICVIYLYFKNRVSSAQEEFYYERVSDFTLRTARVDSYDLVSYYFELYRIAYNVYLVTNMTTSYARGINERAEMTSRNRKANANPGDQFSF